MRFGLGLRPRNALLSGIALMLMTTSIVACGDSDNSNGAKPSPTASANANLVEGYSKCPATGAAASLSGAGATFPAPLYSKWVDQYQKECSVKIDYQAVGSGAGITQITQKTVDFGASDGILTEAQDQAAGGQLVMIPM